MDRVNGANHIDIGGGRRGFRAKNKLAGLAGTEVTALWLNRVQEELIGVQTAAGLDPADDETQLRQAIARIVSGATWFVAGGGANAITLAGTGAFPVPDEYFAGMRVKFLPDAANTGATTINVAGLGAIAARGRRGGALIAGDLLPGEPVEFVHDGSYFRSTMPLLSDALATPYLGFHGDSVSQSIPNNAKTIINSFTGIVNNLPGAIYASGILTIGSSGFYAVTANMDSLLSNYGSTPYGASITVSKVDLSNEPLTSIAATPIEVIPSNFPSSRAAAAAGIAKLTAGDRIAVFFAQNRGSAQNVSVSLDIKFEGA